jgi:sterol desaturase/sphingolipid hydroxylase (fatty acid hydroxylase superfamily)
MPLTVWVCFFCAFATTYYLAALVQAALHRWWGHERRIEWVFADHINGHHALYPKRSLLQDQWLPTPNSAMWRVVLPLCLPSILFWPLVPSVATTGHVAGLVFAVAWHGFLHRQYHLWDSPLGRFGWFRRQRALHCVHHYNEAANFALAETWIDRLMGTQQRCC